jgi:pimeloyl-ACP methyl ester carboxylesterase
LSDSFATNVSDAQAEAGRTAYTESWVWRGAHRIYERLYQGSEPPLVLLHGFPDNLHLYDRLLPHLVPKRQVVTFDFLGWGASDKPSETRTPLLTRLAILTPSSSSCA